MDLIETPVTGRESGLAVAEPLGALSEFYRAFNTRDLALMEHNWSVSDDIAMDNPLGGIKRGWADIKSVYEAIFTGQARVYVEFHGYTLHVVDEVFYVVGRERGTLELPKADLALDFRTSRIFRRTGGRWRQVHHHGSMDDPARLAGYQRAVRG